ncbi:MAG: hypothetical protein R2827_12090 [Bdellovibrionales bacterium]
MALSYAGSELLNINQLIMILMGGGIRTVLTVWIFAVPLQYLDLLLIFVAAFPMMFTKSEVASLAKVVLPLG